MEASFWELGYVLYLPLLFVSAKNASSPAEIVNKLSDVGLSSSSETQTFAQQIFARIDRKSSGPNVSECLVCSN